MSEQHDVIVVGAGPAGSSTAYFLAKQGVDVLLVDKSDTPRDKTCGDALLPRALHVLDQMGVLDELKATSSKANLFRLFAPNGTVVETPIPAGRGAPPYALVMPRLRLDAALLEHAVEAGADFQGKSTVLDIDAEAAGTVSVRIRHADRPRVLYAKGVVIATGAATRLLRELGMLPSLPSFMIAVRAYFENVADINQQLEFYFNHVSLPGYGWMFPTSQTAANIGVGYIGKPPTSARLGFNEFVSDHPRLKEILGKAKMTGPTRSYPLRVDFPRSPKVRPGVVAVGEAVGLVNPFTGEGIDYALESGQIAAEVIADVLSTGEPWTPTTLHNYTRRVNERFRTLFVMTTWARRLYFNEPVLNRILRRESSNQLLVDTLTRVALGLARPERIFSPRVIWGIARPGIHRRGTAGQIS